MNEDFNNENVYLITTKDNPFSPFTEFDNWYKFDIRNGYYTCEYLSNLCENEEQLTSIDEKNSINKAIETMIANDLFNIYKKVTKNDYKNTENGTSKA